MRWFLLTILLLALILVPFFIWEDWFNTLGESVTMVTGLIFVICVLAFRRGIMGEIIAFIDRRRGVAKH